MTQATVSRDISELGLVKAPGADGHVYVTPESVVGRRRDGDRRLGRAARADPRRHPGHDRAQRADPRADRDARHGQRHRPGDRRVEPARAGRARWRATIRSSSSSPTTSRLERWRERFEVDPGTLRRFKDPVNKVVLAYSGGLDTSVAVAWLKEQFGVEVVTLTVDLGGGSLRHGVEASGDVGRRLARVRGGRPRAVRDRLRLAAPPGERPLPGRLSAGHGARPAAHRAAPRRGRQARGRRRGRPRLHRQGQRPGPLRRRDPRPRSGARGHRPDARRDGPDPRPGDRLRRRARDRDPDHQGLAVLDRRQPVGPLVRDRRPRGPVGHAAGRRLRVDRRRRRRPDAGRDRHRLRGRHPGRARRRAARAGRAGRARPRRWAAPTASVASTTSRTAWSGSRAARSTRRRPRPSCTPRTARSRG